MARLGLAVDIGTSNLAAFIVDLDKPKDRFYLSISNSQSRHGADVVTRLTFARDQKNSHALQKLLVSDMNNIIFALCKKIRINRKRIETVAVSANTVMLHMLLGLDLSGFKAYPYRSLIEGPVTVKASDIGIVAGPSTKLLTLSPVSAYLGADVTAGILYTKMQSMSSPKLLVDLGTNAEMVLGSKDGLWAASAAAGPAFKGREILLGSHMISAVARMLRSGQIDRTGRVIVPGPVPQQDIRGFQLAKSAVISASKILMSVSGIKPGKISKILISGLFGEKINIKDALATGLIPDIGKNKVRAIGNSSLEGTKTVLFDPGLIEEAERVAKSVKAVELPLETAYQEEFIRNMDF